MLNIIISITDEGTFKCESNADGNHETDAIYTFLGALECAKAALISGRLPILNKATGAEQHASGMFFPAETD